MPDAQRYRTRRRNRVRMWSTGSKAARICLEEFVHARHLTVAAWCFATMESEAARGKKMRARVCGDLSHTTARTATT